MNYVPLWIKTDYSLLKSLIKIDDLISKLKLLNIDTAAICDDDLFGAIEFYDKCNQNNIKPIIGLNIVLDFEMLLYAKNYEGYQNLCRINTLKNDGKLNIDLLLNNIDNILIIIPYKYKDNINIFDSDNVFIGYNTEEEKNNITGNKVYVKKVLSLEETNEKYLKYLYKIDDKEYAEESDVTIDEGLPAEYKKDTIYFANKCDLKIPKRNDLLPVYNADKDFEADKYLSELCVKGLKKRLNNDVSKEYVDRLKYELSVIIKMGFCNYFLVVWDYVKHAKKSNIMVGPGRGSAASSLVSYALGITNVDPLKYDLLFERFLNPERITMPDIDIDFDALKRGEVISYVTNKYGNDKVSGIITFSNLLAKQVIRDVARIFEISTFKVDNLVKNFDDKKSLKEQLNNANVKNIINNDDDLKRVYDVSMHLEGLKRHTSVHAAGIIISSKKLCDYVPLALNTDGTYLCGYNMNYIEELGLLKMDFLGLKNLSVVDKILSSTDLNFNDIPLDDKKTYELFCSGNLDGVFQFESAGMKKFITDLKPDKIDDLIAAVALFRPGPIDNIPHYVARKHGTEKITYLHEDLEDILKPTYGIIIYQEQIMQIASKMAGFTYGEADVLRRAMSKKKESILIEQKEKFIKGSINKGYDSSVATDVYNLILKFANYGFNKAHSVSYAIIGYKIAYLKVHYPLLFMREILNNYIGIIGKTKSGISECKRLGVEIAKPSINHSGDEYKVSNNKLEYPLSLIKSIGTLTARQIEKERLSNGEYTSYLDYVKRTYKLGKDVIRNMILSGSLDEFKLNRKTMINNMDEALNYAELCNDLDESMVIKPEIVKTEEYTAEELTSQEEEMYGFYISNHPTSKYLKDNSITVNKIDKYFDKTVKMVLLFERKKDIDTKNGSKMMFITASDTTGSIDVVMFPKTYEQYFNILVPGIYEVTAKVEKRFAKMQLVMYDAVKK